jgi:tetratricopeptide (TPR) repeat protein
MSKSRRSRRSDPPRPPETPPAPKSRLGGWIAAAALVLVAAGAWYLLRKPELQPEPVATSADTPEPPTGRAGPEYVGSEACADCHADAYARWRASQHALAMQVASESTVLGDFSGARFTKDGVTSEFFRRDGKFVVRTDGPDGNLKDYEVRHTFGVYPLQQYLVELPGGHVQALPIAWDARSEGQGGQRWFHLYPKEHIDHRDELHWTGRQQNWNFMCADCHSTDVKKNYDAATGTYATTYSEVSVGCEACHGPGSDHVALAREAAESGRELHAYGLTVSLDERKAVAWVIDPATGNAKRSQPRTSSNEIDVCAQCHARRSQFSDDYRPGEPFYAHYRPALLSAELYYADGQQRGEVYKWGSFLSSRMYANGVTCSDCHDPHDGKPRAAGNATCAQCHSAAKYDVPSHHFHERGTAGAACVSCHMATETYMVVDPRHDHSFRIPLPEVSASVDAPNACNACHTDRSAKWAAAEILKRFPEPKPGFQGFAEAFFAADRGDPAAEIALAQIVANHDESAIARASALERLQRFPGETTITTAEAALDDESALVRSAAIPPFEMLQPLQRRSLFPLLSDPSRLVRMQAARSLAPLANDAFDPDTLDAFHRAADEYVAAERFNADRPEHRVNLAGYLADRGDYVAAEAEYRSALAMDPRFAPAWVNLADLMRLAGREADADATLRAGLEQLPDSAALYHSLGLSLVRQHRKAEALVALKRATELDPSNRRYAYVYDVAKAEYSK